MAVTDVVALIDAEIARLQQARTLLATIGNSVSAPARRRGRPEQNAVAPLPSTPAKKKRKLSPEGRARIAAAVKRRWAKQKAETKRNDKA